MQLGEVLIRDGAIDDQQLGYALAEQRKTRLPLGELLVKLGFVTDQQMRQALGRQLHISYIDLDRMILDKSLSRVVNSSYAKRHAIVPVALVGQTLTVCMDNPTNRSLLDDLSQTTSLTVTAVTSSRDAIHRAYQRLYGPPGKTGVQDQGVEIVVESHVPESNPNKYMEERQGRKADELVRRLLSVALRQRASDIHFETLAGRTQIRFRIDGVLESLELDDLQQACDQMSREIVSRVKILAKLDIAERRRPQDGGFRVRLEGAGELANVDIRVSILPSYYGESLVLRLLDRKHAPVSLDQLNLPADVDAKWRQLLHRPSGILLATGPTGSGKSTTLYASLMTMYKPQIRVLTAEDPIEYVYEIFSQSEVNADIGNTFASYLRAFLRHDPEVIMVGEIRDEPTAEMAFRAAQTGHLLLSTLHTDTAVAAIARLLDLRVDPNTIASSLNGVLGQRLVRRICTSCVAEYEPPAELVREFFPVRQEGLTFKKGQGCQQCNYTGYRGRGTVAELWVPSDDDVLLIAKNAPVDEIRASAKRSTFSMTDSMRLALQAGMTNLEELIRVMPYTTIVEFRQNQKAPLTTAA